MTREDIKKQFSEATEEQITAILNIHGTELSSAKQGAIDPAELHRLQGIETKYKELEEADLTDAEKVQKALDDAKEAERKFNEQAARLEVEKIFVTANLKEDDYKEIIDGIVSDDAEKSKKLASSLVTTITAQTESAVQKTKEALMDGTLTPEGGNPGNPNDEKPEDVKNVEGITFGVFGEEAKTARDFYK